MIQVHLTYTYLPDGVKGINTVELVVGKKTICQNGYPNEQPECRVAMRKLYYSHHNMALGIMSALDEVGVEFEPLFECVNFITGERTTSEDGYLPDFL